ncbi:MAG: hypothetical protein ACREO9_07445 [Lysobacterales bacterium]
MTLLPRASARSLAWLLACTLLLAQTLGLMHGVVHGSEVHGLDRGHQHPHGHDHVHDSDADPGTGWLASVFSSHDGEPDCRLFDQGSHGSAAPAMAALCLPMVLSSFVFDVSRSEALARWAALFDARGPPLSR